MAVIGKIWNVIKARFVKPQKRYITAHLNARVLPIDRGTRFEDPLQETFSGNGYGEVTGGGTQLADEPAGIESCDLEILVGDYSDEIVAAIVGRLNELGAPKGSRLILEGANREVPFGVTEGLALFLNGTALGDDVYKACDVNVVIGECNRLMGDGGKLFGHWEGSLETGLYFYGPSYLEMKASISPFIASYPLCQKSRIERIA